MSGFLHRLGARAIGQVAIVPRAAALFEAPPVPALLPALAPDAMSAAPDAVRVAPPADPRPAGPPVRAVDADATPPDATMPRDLCPPEGTTLLTPPRHLSDVNPRNAQARTDAPRPVQRSAAADAPRASAPIEEARHAQPAAATPTLVAVHPLPTPRATALAQAHVAPRTLAAEAAEPVRVTIGRVEVRAVFEQAAPRPSARAAPPSPSLDDYLRKRGRS